MKLYKQKLLLLFLVLLVSPPDSNSIETDSNLIIKQSYEDYLGEHKDDLIRSYQSLLSKLAESENESVVSLLILHEFLIADISKRKDKKKFSKSCIDRNQIIQKSNRYPPEVYAFLSACYGLSAQSNLLKAASHGAKSGRMIERALEIDSNNPFIYLVKGIGDYQRPELFGGSSENAIKNLNRAIDLYQMRLENTMQIGEAIAHYHLAVIYFFTKQEFELSLKHARLALKLEPNYRRAMTFENQLMTIVKETELIN